MTVTVPRHKLYASHYPQASLSAGDLPDGQGLDEPAHHVCTTASRTRRADTTVELWAGTGPRGAGGTMIADGLPPSGAATWTPSGLPSGEYWPYAIVNENGIPVSIRYWPGSIELANPTAPPVPTGVQAVPNSGGAYVFWNEVRDRRDIRDHGDAGRGWHAGPRRRSRQPTRAISSRWGRASGRSTVQAVDAAEHASLPSTAAVVSVA